MSDIKLLPCPFCGGSPRVSRKSGVTGVACRSRYYRETIVCKCGASSKEHKSPGKAVVAWNRRTTLSSAAVAEREPVAFTSAVALEMMRDHWQKINVIGASRFASPINNIPIYLDPPPISELEAENARLRAERDVAVAAMVRNNERSEVAEARLAEAMEALEKSENLFEAISHHIDEHSFSFAKGFCSQGAFTARRVREGGKVE